MTTQLLMWLESKIGLAKIFSSLVVTKPSGCWLMAKYPASTLKGMTSGVAALQAAIELALSQIHSQKESALSAHSPVSLELKTDKSQTFLQLQGGRGATSSRAGSYARVDGFSIEKLERELPIKIQSIDHRASEGGQGKYSGGRGLVMKIEALDNVEAQWLSDLTLYRPRISKNCSHGDPCEVSLETAGSTKVLPVLGHQTLHKGEVLVLCSGAGGGFGKAAPKED